MSEWESLEKKMQQWQPITPSRALRERCIRSALAPPKDNSMEIFTRWFVAACILLLFSFWVKKEKENAFLSSPSMVYEKSNKETFPQEITEIALSNKILLSTLHSGKTDSPSLFSSWDIIRN